MKPKKLIQSALTSLLIAVVLAVFLILMLNMMGLIAFTGGGWLVDTSNMVRKYLGFSILFFLPVMMLFFYRLKSLYDVLSTSDDQAVDDAKVDRLNEGVDDCMKYFIGIGVLFTAWGMQNALQESLGGMDASEAARLGAWEILSRLVNNGILISLWTTIIGGAGGYLMDFIKKFWAGQQLSNYYLMRENLPVEQSQELLSEILLELKELRKANNR